MKLKLMPEGTDGVAGRRNRRNDAGWRITEYEGVRRHGVARPLTGKHYFRLSANVRMYLIKS